MQSKLANATKIFVADLDRWMTRPAGSTALVPPCRPTRGTRTTAPTPGARWRAGTRRTASTLSRRPGPRQPRPQSASNLAPARRSSVPAARTIAILVVFLPAYRTRIDRIERAFIALTERRRAGRRAGRMAGRREVRIPLRVSYPPRSDPDWCLIVHTGLGATAASDRQRRSKGPIV